MAFTAAAAEREGEQSEQRRSRQAGGLSRFGGVEKHKVNRVVNVSPHFALALSLSALGNGGRSLSIRRNDEANIFLSLRKSKDAQLFWGRID